MISRYGPPIAYVLKQVHSRRTTYSTELLTKRTNHWPAETGFFRNTSALVSHLLTFSAPTGQTYELGGRWCPLYTSPRCKSLILCTLAGVIIVQRRNHSMPKSDPRQRTSSNGPSRWSVPVRPSATAVLLTVRSAFNSPACPIQLRIYVSRSICRSIVHSRFQRFVHRC